MRQPDTTNPNAPLHYSKFLVRYSRFKIYAFLIVIAFIGAIQFAFGQINSWNHYLYTTKDGLPSDKIRNVVQDHDGFIWIATESGLCRFDGDEFEMVLHDPKDKTTIPSDAINFVNIMPDGRLLVSTMEGLFVMNTRTMMGVTLHFYTQKGWESYDDYMHDIKINTQLKKVIVLSSTAFSYFDYDLTHIETIPYQFPSGDVNKGKNLTNYSPFFLPNGDALFMDNYSGQLSWVDYHQKKIKPLKEAPSHPYYALSAYEQIDCSSMDPAGNIWVHSYGIDTLFCCAPNRNLIAYPLKGDYKKVSWWQQISFPDAHRMVWGFYKDEQYEMCELPYQDMLKYPGVDVTISSRSGLKVSSYTVYGDKAQNWWIASAEGLYLVKENHHTFQKIDLPLPYENTRDWQYITDIARVDKDQMLITTLYEHCHLYDIPHNTVISYLDTLSIAESGYYRMEEIFNTDSNRYLILGEQDLTFQNGKLQMGFRPILSWQALFKKYATSAIFKDRKGYTWVSFKDYGLVKWDPDKSSLQYFKPGDQFYSGSFKSITEDNNGDIWFVPYLQSTLSKYDTVTGKFETFDLKGRTGYNYKWISGMVAGDNGWLYLASMSGLILYNTIDKSIQEITMKDGLPSNTISGLFYCQGHLFISSQSGWTVMNASTFAMNILKHADGIFENVTTQAYYLDTATNTLYVGGKGFVYKIELKALFASENKVNVVINHTKVNEQAVDFGKTKLILQPTENNISFSVSSIDFYSGINKKYFYRIILNGKPSEWISNQHNKQFSFINLAPGDYTIEVRSKNADNNWSVNTAEISFTILKPWYNQGWFYVLCLLTTGLIMRAIYTYRIRQIRSVERIRSKLSRDLHDDIGSTLSSINILSQMARHNAPESSESKTTDALEKINERSQRLLDNMSDIVWSIKPENDTLDEMLTRMRQYATGMLESKGIDYTIEFPTEKTDFKLPLEVKNNIYLIFKEAVNNLCKYAQCRQAHLTLSIENKKMRMVVQDDGIGFSTDITTNSHGGNGLKNMRQRAAEIKAELLIDSSSGKGTSVSLVYRLL